MDLEYRCCVCDAKHSSVGGAALCANSHFGGPAYATPQTVEETNPAGVAYPAPEMPTVQAAELLGRAARHMHDRAATYDKPEGERSMGRTVQAFNAITGHNLSESEGWLIMALLKAVRGFTREAYHADSFEDMIAYAALMSEARGAGL